jgi:ubiquinone/menaquinone biosynthesis C-methylase UbiE
MQPPNTRHACRVLEPEVMDSEEEARDYDTMDHSAVNRVFAADFLAEWGTLGLPPGPELDVGTGTAQIPIEVCRQNAALHITGIDLAEHMLALGRVNLRQAGLEGRICLERCDAKALPYPSGHFTAVISNSIVHHIPEPERVFAEMVRVTAPGGLLFVRDLLRPADEAEVRRLVELYAADANEHQRKMFGDSLRAALTLAEVQAIVAAHGFDPSTVRQTTDRHWTWSSRTRNSELRARNG